MNAMHGIAVIYVAFESTLRKDRKRCTYFKESRKFWRIWDIDYCHKLYLSVIFHQNRQPSSGSRICHQLHSDTSSSLVNFCVVLDYTGLLKLVLKGYRCMTSIRVLKIHPM